MMLERQREGINKAQKAGKYKRHKPIHEEKRAAILRLANEGVSKVEIAKQLGVGQVAVYRELALYHTAAPRSAVE
jgi:DNA invertase Pin-like site-specific DNA recombinase